MSHCSTAPCCLPDTPDPLRTLMGFTNPLCFLKKTMETRAKNPPRSPPLKSPPISITYQSVIHKVEETHGRIRLTRIIYVHVFAIESFFFSLIFFLIKYSDIHLYYYWTALVKNTYLHPGNSPLTFWNSLLKTDHLPFRTVSAKGERSHGEKCASAAATWCVCAKTQTIPVRVDLMVSSGCKRFRKGKKSSVLPPLPSLYQRYDPAPLAEV